MSVSAAFLAQRHRGLLCQAHKEESQARRIPITAGTQRCHPPLPRPHQRKPKTLYLDQGPKQNYRRCQTRAPSVRFDPLARVLLLHKFYVRSSGVPKRQRAARRQSIAGALRSRYQIAPLILYSAWAVDDCLVPDGEAVYPRVRAKAEFRPKSSRRCARPEIQLAPLLASVTL